MDGRRGWKDRDGGTGTGRLIVAAVPIGQSEDASPRLASALASADVVAAEDTRRVRRLAAELGVAPAGRIVSYYDAVEQSRVPGLLDALAHGQDVLLVADAGMPGVSDPGYRLVAAAARAGIPVTAVAGPSAVTTALAVSGLPTDRFCFEGFWPRRAGDRLRRFAELASEQRTLVFFESARRLASTLSELARAFGPERQAVVCRELTKTHEEIRRGTLADLAQWAAGGVLGEVTVVVHGAGPAPPATTEQVVADVAARERSGVTRRDAIAAVARESGLRRGDVYNAVVRAEPVQAAPERSGRSHRT